MRYIETEPGCDLDLSDNTNLWGAPPSVRRTLAETDVSRLSRYPSAYSDQLKAALARYVGVDPSMIVVGCGSDDVLDSAIRSLTERGDTLAQLEPSFSMIPVFAGVSGVSVIRISRADVNLTSAFSDAAARVTYLCSPNNPTGEALSADVIEMIVAAARGVVIIDEAYAEFAENNSLGLLEGYDNVLITRTMSKAFGMAGLRIGYGVGSPAIIERVETARGPYKVTTVAECTALAVLRDDMDWVAEKAGEAVTNRRRFATELCASGYPPLDSRANFVLVPVENSTVVERVMRERGVAVRRFEKLATIGDAVRIGIGPWPMMERCLDAFRAATS
ncbi:MAG: histidinol-phosphate transaminase [Gemmatimonadales bacterium]